MSHFEKPETRSLPLSLKSTCYASGCAHIYEFPGYPKAVSGGSPCVTVATDIRSFARGTRGGIRIATNLGSHSTAFTYKKPEN